MDASTSIDLVLRELSHPTSLSPKEPWPEPLNTPGVIPQHLTRTAATSAPLLEVLQRILYRIRPAGTNDLGTALALLGLYQAIRPAYSTLKDFFMWACTVQVTIPESDPVAREVLAWIGAEVVEKSHTRSAMLITGGLENSNANYHHPLRLGGVPNKEQDQEVVTLPPLGTRLFCFRPFLFSRTGGQGYSFHNGLSGHPVNDKGEIQNALTLTTIGWDLAPLRAFTTLCNNFKRKNLSGTTTVYFAGGDRYDPGGGWQSVSKAVRKLDTIDMDEQVKSDLIHDAEYYYSDESRKFFSECGIPYRRGYLFHGPPGTGKSSLSLALAGHLQCDIYHINLSSEDINDSSLHRMFLHLPRKCVVVLEDIDSAGIGREHAQKKKPGPAEHPQPTTSLGSTNPSTKFTAATAAAVVEGFSERKRNAVTLSGLLSAIDGNASQEGRLLIMTSNNPDSLDEALTRPGRVDKKVYFGNIGKSAGRSIFMRLIGRSALAHNASFTVPDIENFADKFADKLPDCTFTPAQVQNYLQGCRGDPHMALDEIDTWVIKNCGKSDTTDTRVVSEKEDFVAGMVEIDNKTLNLNNSKIEELKAEVRGGNSSDAGSV